MKVYITQRVIINKPLGIFGRIKQSILAKPIEFKLSKNNPDIINVRNFLGQTIFNVNFDPKPQGKLVSEETDQLQMSEVALKFLNKEFGSLMPLYSFAFPLLSFMSIFPFLAMGAGGVSKSLFYVTVLSVAWAYKRLTRINMCEKVLDKSALYYSELGIPETYWNEFPDISEWLERRMDYLKNKEEV